MFFINYIFIVYLFDAIKFCNFFFIIGMSGVDDMLSQLGRKEENYEFRTFPVLYQTTGASRPASWALCQTLEGIKQAYRLH